MSEELIKKIKEDPNYYMTILNEELKKIIENYTPIILKDALKGPGNFMLFNTFQERCITTFQARISGDISSLREEFPKIEHLEKLYNDEDTPAWRPETGKVDLTNTVGEYDINYKKRLELLVSKQSEDIKKLKEKFKFFKALNENQARLMELLHNTGNYLERELK